MPFLLHKDDVLTEAKAASDYQRWLDADDVMEGIEDGLKPQRGELGLGLQEQERRFEIEG